MDHQVGLVVLQGCLMAQALSKPLTLPECLEQPETKPASEYINGEIIQKSMPEGLHSLLQGNLCATINQVVEEPKLAYAFPELRCSFGGRSIVPDVAVFKWDRFPFTHEGEVPDNFDLPPNTAAEVLYPEQMPNRVLGNILHCLEHASHLGWFFGPDAISILVLLPQQQTGLSQGKQLLPFFCIVDIILAVGQVLDLLEWVYSSLIHSLFGWLGFGKCNREETINNLPINDQARKANCGV